MMRFPWRPPSVGQGLHPLRAIPFGGRAQVPILLEEKQERERRVSGGRVGRTTASPQ